MYFPRTIINFYLLSCLSLLLSFLFCFHPFISSFFYFFASFLRCPPWYHSFFPFLSSLATFRPSYASFLSMLPSFHPAFVFPSFHFSSFPKVPSFLPSILPLLLSFLTVFLGFLYCLFPFFLSSFHPSLLSSYASLLRSLLCCLLFLYTFFHSPNLLLVTQFPSSASFISFFASYLYFRPSLLPFYRHVVISSSHTFSYSYFPFNYLGTLILVRHGQTTLNYNKTFTGWIDNDLSDVGIREVKHKNISNTNISLHPDRKKCRRISVFLFYSWV